MRANKWVNRLKEFNTHLSDMKLRNQIISELLLQMQTRVLKAPFDKDPRFTTLESIAPMPAFTAENIFPEQFKLPQIMRQSPDQGVFLVSQPVPKCGAFCYLAVVSRPSNN
jgi:Domain of unknown function (DUF4485)